MSPTNKINVEIRIKPSIESCIDSTDKTVSVGTKTYSFDKIHLTTSQRQLYKNSVEPLVEQFIGGYNCSVLAYGQTGSGKTYTMGISETDTTGVVPQALEYLFSQQRVVCCTFIEIYNEDVIDLLSNHKVPLSLREIKGEVHIAGATEIDLHSVEEGLDVLRRGCHERTTKSTKMNSQSSRSHAIFTLFLRTAINNTFVSSKFSFVDLAGSERLKRTMCIGERARESISINSGLLALGNVISALYKKSRHVPFRDSKLTRILQSCLNSHVLMIACISSCQFDISETHNTLKYANRAASIQTTTKLNVEIDNSKMALMSLKKEITKLKNENQILKTRLNKVERINKEELLRENRDLKSRLDNSKYEDFINDKTEDLAQEILKHPFVQNLINDNQKLSEEIETLRGMQAVSRSGESEGVGDKAVQNTNYPIDNSSVDMNCQKKEPVDTNDTPPNRVKHKLNEGTATFNSTASPAQHEPPSSEQSPERIVCKGLNALEILAETKGGDDGTGGFNKKRKSDKAGDQKISWNGFVKSKERKVTFKMDVPLNKKALFTPRKEKVKLNTDIVRFVEGFTPQSMVVHTGDLVFSSLDNRVRVWRERVEELFTDPGVRHLESSDLLYYTTRTILKQFDCRSPSLPLHAYKSEINCIKKIGHLIYTGHDDGTLNIFDLRRMQLDSVKLHSGSIFCLEHINGKIYTGSRDHSVKSLSNGIVSLSPPHCDSVIGLLSYKGDLISLGRDSSVRRWSGNKLVRTVNNSHCSSLRTGVSLEDAFVTGDKSGLLKFWDFHKSNLFTVGELNMNNPINCLCAAEGGFYVGTSKKNISFVVAEYIL